MSQQNEAVKSLPIKNENDEKKLKRMKGRILIVHMLRMSLPRYCQMKKSMNTILYHIKMKKKMKRMNSMKRMKRMITTTKKRNSFMFDAIVHTKQEPFFDE